MYKDGKRMMAWVAKIDEVQKHPNADSLDICTVGGWKCVTKLGEFKQNDLAVYVSIDSWIPTELAPFLSKGQEPREYNGVKGERLRTVKLRGALSQGLLLKPADVMAAKQFTLAGVGGDVTELLGIQKYEPPVPAQLSGQVRGNFPTAVPKTDQERVQNLKKEVAAWTETGTLDFCITEKLEGSSMTCFLDNTDNELYVCSRNLSLKRDENNTFWKVAIQNNIENRMVVANLEGYAIQGELIGPGIQGNIYKLNTHEFMVFHVYNTHNGEYLSLQERLEICEILGLKHVPVISSNFVLNHTIDEILDFAKGKSKILNTQEREGVVFECNTNRHISFKSINNNYLLSSKL